MLALLTAWDWTEVAEGTLVALLFAAVPVILHHEHRYRRMRDSHRRLHDKLDKLA